VIGTEFWQFLERKRHKEEENMNATNHTAKTLYKKSKQITTFGRRKSSQAGSLLLNRRSSSRLGSIRRSASEAVGVGGARGGSNSNLNSASTTSASSTIEGLGLVNLLEKSKPSGGHSPAGGSGHKSILISLSANSTPIRRIATDKSARRVNIVEDGVLSAAGGGSGDVSSASASASDTSASASVSSFSATSTPTNPLKLKRAASTSIIAHSKPAARRSSLLRPLPTLQEQNPPITAKDVMKMQKIASASNFLADPFAAKMLRMQSDIAAGR
jgi:hypothetical protein